MNGTTALTTEAYLPVLRPFGTVVPVVVDASVLGRDIARCARGIDDHPPFLQAAASSRTLRILVPEAQADEPLHAATSVGAAQGIDPRHIRAVWLRDYRPYVRIVGDPGRAMDDPRLSALAERDPTDVPLGRLAARLAPIVCLSDDDDLVDNELGFDIGGANGARLVLTANTAWRSRDLAIVGVRAAAHGTAAALRSLRVRPELGIAVAVVTAAGVWWLRMDSRLSIKPFLRALTTFGENLADLWLTGSLAERQLEQAVVTRHEPERVDDEIARILAVAPQPMPIPLLRESVPSRLDPETQDLEDILKSDPAFVRVSSGWELGRRADEGNDLPP